MPVGVLNLNSISMALGLLPALSLDAIEVQRVVLGALATAVVHRFRTGTKGARFQFTSDRW